MNNRLIILSDLWGKEKSDWLVHYIELLDKHFDIHYYDCCELGGVNKSNYTEKNLHQQFVQGGIERASQALTQLENSPAHILAFSIGGTIGWQFGTDNQNLLSLTCISSTRLRHETIKTNREITLYFGEKDIYQPATIWFENMSIRCELIEGKGHQLYREREIAHQICNPLIEKLVKNSSS